MKTRFVFAVLSVLALLLVTGSAEALPEYAPPPPGTAFTYQGRLTVGGSPATMNYDFEFSLWDTETVGTQVGSTLTQGNVAVTDGLFTVQLDFGEVFDGTALWLQIGVAAGGSGGPYTTLDPRQPLSPTPYAIFAGTAASAPWDGLTGVPLGFADGVDDEASYQNVLIVAKSGGDFTTITAALNSITASDSNRYLIYVAPGVYSEQVTMEPYVDIQGSGELNTKITFTGSALDNTGTLLGADNAELRFLTVENTGGDDYSTAIYNSSSVRLTHVVASASGGSFSFGVINFGSSATLTNVTATASGAGNNYGVFSYQSSATMRDVTASASGGASNHGVYNQEGSPTMTNVTASASGGSVNFGVFNFESSPSMTSIIANGSGGSASYGVYNTSSSPTMNNVTASASLGTNNYGVYNTSSSFPTMNNVTASGSGGTNTYGVYSALSQPTLTNVTASGSGGTNNYGVYTTSLGTLLVNNSKISGSTNTLISATSTIRIGASQLSGGPVSGTVTCAGVYDEAYVFYASTCP